MNRRYFFKQLASGLVAAAAPALFLPKLIKPQWKAPPKSWVRFIDPAAPGQDGMVMMCLEYKVTETGVTDMKVTRVAPLVSRWQVEASTAHVASLYSRWTGKPVTVKGQVLQPGEAMAAMEKEWQEAVEYKSGDTVRTMEKARVCDVAIGFEKV